MLVQIAVKILHSQLNSYSEPRKPEATPISPSGKESMTGEMMKWKETVVWSKCCLNIILWQYWQEHKAPWTQCYFFSRSCTCLASEDSHRGQQLNFIIFPGKSFFKPTFTSLESWNFCYMDRTKSLKCKFNLQWSPVGDAFR